jgi:hypothetical protein
MVGDKIAFSFFATLTDVNLIRLQNKKRIGHQEWMFNHGLPYGFPSGSVGNSSMPEIDPAASVVLPPDILPPDIFPIVALSAVICASTELMTVSPVIDRVAPESMANIATIVIVFIIKCEVFTSI